jgi:urease accessory protein
MLTPLQNNRDVDAAMHVTHGAADPDIWRARLSLAFEADSRNGKTLLRAAHTGPLRIQKALYPEGPHRCHAIIVHPPAGIAAGDDLSITSTIPLDSAALITTPGATKWYGSSGATARQRIGITLSGALEWLPLESIVFDGAEVDSDIVIDASDTARMVGWDILVFGRKARGERFTHGRFRQSIRLRLEGSLVWEDRLALTGSDRIMNSPVGMAGRHSLATCWALHTDGREWTETDLTTLRSACQEIAWTILHPRLLVGRMLDEPLRLRHAMTHAWTQLRPLVLGQAAVPPRIWAT